MNDATDTPTMTLGDLAKERDALRESKRALKREEAALTEALDANEARILELLDAQNVEATRVNGISLSISEQTMPSVTDWDALYAWIKENDAFYLLQRRAAAGPYRELLQMEQEVPGVEPHIKRSINMRVA
mgnify:CR=1 FL=1